MTASDPKAAIWALSPLYGKLPLSHAVGATFGEVTMRILLLATLLVFGAPTKAQDAAAPSSTERVSNPEMTGIFAADQAARESDHVDWATIGPADQARRTRTQALLDAGMLNSADDFYHAAFVFQHGDKPEDYLKAHALAVVAAARGKPEAAWIAAATLDRYLQHIGQPQIYGTQFLREAGKQWSQEPYRRDLLSDAMRLATGVPVLSEQEGQLKKMNLGR